MTPLTIGSSAAKSLQSCPILSDPIDVSPPGSPVPGILQARTPEWVAISFSNTWKWKVKVKSLSRVWLLAIPWTAAHQAPLSMGFSRQEYWNGVPLPSTVGSSMSMEFSRKDYCRGSPFPFQGDLSNTGIEPRSPACQAECLPSEPPRSPTYGWMSTSAKILVFTISNLTITIILVKVALNRHRSVVVLQVCATLIGIVK